MNPSSPKGPFYWSLFGLIAMAILTTFQDAFTDQRVDGQEWVQVAIGAVTAINVYLTANLPGYDKAKIWVTATLAALQSLYTFVVGGVDTPELINLAVVFLAGLGVVVTAQPITTVINNRTRVFQSADGMPRTTTTEL